jgi:hydrogenase maturation protein HypF
METISRQRLTIGGQVQGVGFRPTVYRVALDQGLTGLVRNAPEGVVIEVQGVPETVAGFEAALRIALPPLARITECRVEDIPPEPDEAAFTIQKTTAGQGHAVLISPDTCVCADCLADMADADGPRHRYAFTNCTNCGPRYTITRSIPYDRETTSMACFPMCARCQAEYDDPLDRRFHAQPNACPECGPRLWLTDPEGTELAEHGEAITRTAAMLRDGKLCAIKGLGGFHLACDARNEAAVSELRTRKNRHGKPLAIMVPDLATARGFAEVSEAEAELLASPKRPIVLLRTRQEAGLAASLAPDTDRIGVMLPYTPLHHVLFDSLGAENAALVMTSGNTSGEPICIGNREALRRLSHIADAFLLHDRDILIRTDDSVVRAQPETGRTQFFRRARGYTPAPIDLARKLPCVLGAGPELKNTLTYIKGEQAFVSQHIGDMENLATLEFFTEIADHLRGILQVEPVAVVRDLHPDFMSSRWAEQDSGLPCAPLQHHYAHGFAVLAENRHQGPALVLALDGTGLGDDGTIWGGEALLVDTQTLDKRRLGHLAQVALPGGEAAVLEPWRMAKSHLHALGVTEPKERSWTWLDEFAQADRVVAQMLAKGLNCPPTTSCGRLFDAVAGLLGIAHAIHYEGQAAIMLEAAQDHSVTEQYDCPVREGDPFVLDTLALFRACHDDWRAGVAPGVISRKFHLGLVAGLAELAARLAARTGLSTVGLSGGVLQNLTMSVELPRALEARGLEVLVHHELPPGDACVSFGQAYWGARAIELAIFGKSD